MVICIQHHVGVRTGQFVKCHPLGEHCPSIPYNRSMNNFSEFIEYVYSFYGPNGLYDQNRTKEQIAFATLTYLDDCDNPNTVTPNMTWGDGDSLDRERVRDYMNDIYGPVPVTAIPGVNC